MEPGEEKINESNESQASSIVKSFANFLGEFIDDETKDLINKFSIADENDRSKLFSEYVKKYPKFCIQKESAQRKEENDIDKLVVEKKNINNKIANLSEKDQVEFWAKYHDIPTENDKLDAIMDSIKTLNANIVQNFNEKLDDIYTEISIIRKNMKNN